MYKTDSVAAVVDGNVDVTNTVDVIGNAMATAAHQM